MTTNPRWKHRPAGSTWGDFGADDQLGRLNLLTPEKVKQGIAEVHEGLTFCLSLPLDYPGGTVLKSNRFPPIVRPNLRNGEVNFLYQMGTADPELLDVLNDDLAIIHLQYSSQWDSLAHYGQLFDADGDGVAEPVFYNGFRGGVDIVGPSDAKDAGSTTDLTSASTSCAKRLGIENMAEKCVQGRAVMVDLYAHFGSEQRFIGYEELMRVFDADKVVVEAGDIVCFHTGCAQRILEMEKKPTKDAFANSFVGLDGRDERLLGWITDSQVVALIADNAAVETSVPRAVPGVRAEVPLHAHCLFKLGVHLGEYFYLTELANWLRAHNRTRFLLTAPPLRLPGAVGSPPAPIATV